MMRILCFLSVVTLSVSGGRADEYWFAYEATDRFPEEEGWRRFTTGGGAVRSLENGQLIIDGRRSIEITDRYEMNLEGNLDPDPGERFVARWRVRVDEVSSNFDAAVAIEADDNRAVLFLYEENRVFNWYDPAASAQFTPRVFHDFEFRSSDMRAYELRIDGLLAVSGSFRPSLGESRVGWGDATQGTSSLTTWDYFRFGVVPEPGPVVMLLITLTAMLRRR